MSSQILPNKVMLGITMNFDISAMLHPKVHQAFAIT